MNEFEQACRIESAKRGIDPDIAAIVANSEGGLTEPAREGAFATGHSWWAFQLHYGGVGFERFGTTAGMGNSFTALTGWQPGDPLAWRDAMRYALDGARRGGWGAWFGARANGITGFTGIDRSQPWDGTPPNEWDYKSGATPALVFDANHPAHPQEEHFDCSQESLEWALWSCGKQSQDDWLENAMLDQGVMSKQDGLLDATGAGLAAFVNREYREFGFSASNEKSVTFALVAAEAGRYPLLIGGRTWGHWSGVRGYDAARNVLLLANPAQGFKGIRQEMTPEQFTALGQFSLVRILIGGGNGEDDMYKAMWEGTLGVIAEIGDNVADALEQERARLDDYGDPPAPPAADASREELSQYALAMQAWAESVRANTDIRYQEIGNIGQRLRDIRVDTVGPRQ
jgi:hypothetical protein